MSEFGWAYIGCGGIARTTASELVQTDDNTIIAAWNRTKEKAESFVEDFGGKVYDTAEEAIRAEGVEGVYVNVNGDQHAYYTKLAIDLGKPVLCEKPFTFNEKETKDLLYYAAEKDFSLDDIRTFLEYRHDKVLNLFNEHCRTIGKG